jgi:hypothetical protein
MQLLVLNLSRPQACDFPRVIPEIDIWRAANLMLKRYGDKALEESATRADELTAAGDDNGAATWRGSPPRSTSSPTTHRPDRCTDRNAPVTTRRHPPPSTGGLFLLFYREYGRTAESCGELR